MTIIYVWLFGGVTVAAATIWISESFLSRAILCHLSNAWVVVAGNLRIPLSHYLESERPIGDTSRIRYTNKYGKLIALSVSQTLFRGGPVLFRGWHNLEQLASAIEQEYGNSNLADSCKWDTFVAVRNEFAPNTLLAMGLLSLNMLGILLVESSNSPFGITVIMMFALGILSVQLALVVLWLNWRITGVVALRQSLTWFAVGLTVLVAPLFFLVCQILFMEK